ncbi:hypothetical protein ACLF96_00560 [Helicobacter pylori]
MDLRNNLKILLSFSLSKKPSGSVWVVKTLLKGERGICFYRLVAHSQYSDFYSHAGG